MKVLKQFGKVTKHHNLLLSDELKAIFNHNALSVNTTKGIQFTKFSQKNDPGGIEENLDLLMILEPLDSEGYLGPIHDIKLYLNRRPTNCNSKWYLDAKLGQNLCSNFMKNICSKVGINIKDHDIVNHSEKTKPIMHLFREGILIITLISITGHKSESSYHIYSRPSEQQKMDILSILINVVDLPESQNNKDDSIIDSNKIYDPKPNNHPNSYIPPKRLVYSEFQSPLKDSMKVNLPSYSNATKKNLSLGTTIINNYYLDAEHITINQY
ncbi:41064_t:CDS:2 [Gigaspora margarita]|uniref:41064_t:CDS:1 n=1 Tax=Gigaspora margarita TaxID=4874 RepID=A0ABM8W1C0_GIGMA|nr:41064_t:CDS:2 [Gigaspora margarita]